MRRIVMLSTHPVSPDGVRAEVWEEGSEHLTSDLVAGVVMRNGWAVPADEWEAARKGPAPENKALESAPENKVVESFVVSSKDATKKPARRVASRRKG